jgi:hypothetical protein
MTANNCTNPPHFPPHCGCPAGVAPRPLWLSPQATVTTTAKDSK